MNGVVLGAVKNKIKIMNGIALLLMILFLL